MSNLSNFIGKDFNTTAVLPYLTDFYSTFNWHRDNRGFVIVEGYIAEDDVRNHFLCDCGHYEESGFHCSDCGREPPWGCDCSFCNEERFDYAAYY